MKSIDSSKLNNLQLLMLVLNKEPFILVGVNLVDYLPSCPSSSIYNSLSLLADLSKQQNTIEMDLNQPTNLICILIKFQK